MNKQGHSALISALALLLSALLTTDLHAAEYFVNKQGADGNGGLSQEEAFLTIQKGVNALTPGDTLTIGPGEYSENVKLLDFGDLDKETLIRAEVAGTALLRGDRDADLDFIQVPGRRFVYAADCDTEVLALFEADTLTVMAPAADATSLEFGPGRYYYDGNARKLYVSSSDFQSPKRHCYRISVIKGSGFLLRESRRLTIDGLAASGFMTPVGQRILSLPTGGFLLHGTQKCLRRRCTAFFNDSGIAANNVGRGIEEPGYGNVVEGCHAYGNGADGIVIYNPDGATIRDCRSFLNRIYGARFYGTRRGDAVCRIADVLAWGNPGGDFWTKGVGLRNDELTVAERCIAFRDFNVGNIQHCILGGRNTYYGNRSTSITLPDGHNKFHPFADSHFADPANFDFRLQGTSSLRQSGPDKTDVGPYPYKPNIYYVKTDGDDGMDGLSMAAAWKTPARAVEKLQPGATLYIAPGRYAGDLTVTARDVRIRGRGLEPAVIGGALRVVGGEAVSVERIQVSGPLLVEKGKEIAFSDCVLSGPSVRAEQVEGLRMTHNLFTVPLNLQGCSQVLLSGDLYAAAPAVSADSLDAVRYSSYNSYPDAERCWEVGGKVFSLKDLRPDRDAYSMILVPELKKTGGATVVGNQFQFAGRGPLSTAIGPHREWKPKRLELTGPFVTSRSETSADIEWWSTLPVEVDLYWGDTPECVNQTRISQTAYHSYSLIGLEPGKKYYVKIEPRAISPNADPARRFGLSEQKTVPVEFTPAGGQVALATYYVAPDGNDANDGLSRETAWKSLQHAADQVRPGDTVLISGGAYPGSVYFRTTGEPGKPITFKAMSGEKVTIDGLKETLTVGFVLYRKHFYRFDGLYFDGFAGIADNVGGAENGALIVAESSNVQVTRCHFGGGWGPALRASRCPDMLVKNCVFMHSMTIAVFSRCANLAVENNVFVNALIHHVIASGVPGAPARIVGNIFGENTRGKVHTVLVFLQPWAEETNNCFYVRWPRAERKVIKFVNDLTLPEYQARAGDTGSFVANPKLAGAIGFHRGSGPHFDNQDFNGLFATDPLAVKRGVGLQPEVFRDFHFWKKDWPYDKAWAEEVLAAVAAAEELEKAGKNAEAMAAYVKLADETTMEDQLRAELLDRAAVCANRLDDYDKAMELAKRIPDVSPETSANELSIVRQIALMVEHGKAAELLKRFGNLEELRTLSWYCPDNEIPLADAFYYRALAYAQTGDLENAEKELMAMIVRGKRYDYYPCATVLDLTWKRLGDFYRTWMNDDAKALEAYGKVISRTTLIHADREVPKAPLLGDSEVLVAATEAACDILRGQGKQEAARKLQEDLLKVQSEARKAVQGKP